MTSQCSRRFVVGLLLGLGLVTSGCATTFRSDDTTAASIPEQAAWLAGTWYGSSYQVAASSTYYGASLTARFAEDGTWTAVETRKGRIQEFAGTSRIRGNQILLVESSGRFFLTLKRSGNRLYGMYAFSDGLAVPLAIELTRAE